MLAMLNLRQAPMPLAPLAVMFPLSPECKVGWGRRVVFSFVGSHDVLVRWIPARGVGLRTDPGAYLRWVVCVKLPNRVLVRDKFVKIAPELAFEWETS